MIKLSLPPQLIAATGLPSGVLAGQTTRHPINPLSKSAAPFGDFNLALHVGDDAQTVQQQRIELLKALQPYGAKQLVWLEQTHSTHVHEVTEKSISFSPIHADALITRQTGVACMIMTADCLPIVLSNADGSEVGCIHAGWRGLLGGIIENTVNAMQSPAVFAWLGAAIGAERFEVGAEVYGAFTQDNPAAASAFVAQGAGKYLADIYQLAGQRLQRLGVQHISGATQCSYQQSATFYSYRHTPKTGRMATFVMIQSP
ncbi:MAG: peptidoglycan editing factor PgeF [Moraxellaceae bacterium]|nr:MAG: peptidoglycan editing factor PgeF [Moraxellaceae bacterium]